MPKNLSTVDTQKVKIFASVVDVDFGKLLYPKVRI